MLRAFGTHCFFYSYFQDCRLFFLDSSFQIWYYIIKVANLISKNQLSALFRPRRHEALFASFFIFIQHIYRLDKCAVLYDWGNGYLPFLANENSRLRVETPTNPVYFPNDTSRRFLTTPNRKRSAWTHDNTCIPRAVAESKNTANPFGYAVFLVEHFVPILNRIKYYLRAFAKVGNQFFWSY